MSTIKVRNLSKRYALGSPTYGSLRESLTGIFRGSDNSARETIFALDGVSFEVGEGETLGIIGRNGAGKSTLLKILSRITKPTSGNAEIRGRVGSLLEVGTGFHKELSGRDNIYLNGAILGMKRAEIDKKFDEIVAFSEVERFLDTPVKHYSSGMYMRLAFSVAAHLEPEVLVVDEVLAVGDSSFQQKCLGKMNEFGRSGRTVLFVSHNLGSLAQVCQKGLLLNNGKVVFDGSIDEAIGSYLALTSTERQYKIDELDPAKAMQFTEAFLTNAQGHVINEIAHDQPFNLEFEATIGQIGRGTMFCVALLNRYKQRVFTQHKEFSDLGIRDRSEIHVKFGVPGGLIAPNDYSFLIQMFLPSGEVIDGPSDICPFTVIDTGTDLAAYRDYGSMQINGDWQMTSKPK